MFLQDKLDLNDKSAPPDAQNQNGLISAVAHPWRLLGIMTVAGIVIENLIHGEPPALGFALATVVTLGVVIGVARLHQIQLGASHWFLMGSTLFFAAMLGVRASESMKVYNIMAVFGLLLLLAYLLRQGDQRRLSVGSLLGGLIAATVSALMLPFAFFMNDLPAERPQISTQSGWVRVLIGGLVALPILVTFAALFASADAVFARVLDDLWRWDLASIFSHGFFSLFIIWLGLGLLRFALTHTISPQQVDTYLGQQKIGLGMVELLTVLVLVNLLFLAFVAIQFAYLFGGLDTLAQTGLTFSEYARRGFFELVAVAILVIVLVLALDWLARLHTGPALGWMNRLHALLLVTTGIVLVSALQRMRLYVDAYGLTELRFYTTATMLWIGFGLFWAGFTVLRRRRPTFVPGALLAAVIVLAGVNLINPDAAIARYNLTRTPTESTLDAAYLTAGLSDDAVPTLVASLPNLGQEEQADMRRFLMQRVRQKPDGDRSWRGMDLGTLRANRALAAMIER